MDRAHLEPFATTLVSSYLETAAYSRSFKDDYGYPPTVMAKAHHFRAVVQARLAEDERFELDPAYAEFGKVQVSDRETGKAYLLRSHRAVKIENQKRSQNTTLFPTAEYLDSDVLMLVYRFDAGGMDLAYTGSRRRDSKFRLEPVGVPEPVGMWPYTITDVPTFDQGEDEDPFGDVGDIADEADDR